MKLITAGPDEFPPNADVPEAAGTPEWPWKAGIVAESTELIGEISRALVDAKATESFVMTCAGSSSFEVASAIDRSQPEVLFVEFAKISKAAAEWLHDIRRGGEMPLVIAIHPTVDPAEMISALRAGANEFLSIPIRPAIYQAMERLGSLLESRMNEKAESGRIVGLLSAKGGCGATSLACYLSACLQSVEPRTRVLVADMDYQSPGVPKVFHKTPTASASEVFESIRRLSSSSWRDFVTPVQPGIDLLASPSDNALGNVPELIEPWRTEALFRFIGHHYNWVLVDLGRHLNPANWSLMQHIEDLLVVTVPDVLALYQTRSVLQTLTNRGFDRSRIKLVLNRNQNSPADFWVESIQQMFEMGVFGVVPNDEATVEKISSGQFELRSDTPLGKALGKIAAKLVKANTNGPVRRAA